MPGLIYFFLPFAGFTPAASSSAACLAAAIALSTAAAHTACATKCEYMSHLHGNMAERAAQLPHLKLRPEIRNREEALFWRTGLPGRPDAHFALRTR